MHQRRQILGALALLLSLAACGTNATSRVAVSDTQLASDVVATAQFTPEQIAYLEAQARLDAERRAFLEAVAAVRAAVPDELRRIMWCEAGSYLSLPRYTTNYAAMTHGYDGASGGAQMLGSTWLAWAREIGVDVAAWPRAFTAPDFVQDAVATHGYLTRGSAPWRASIGCWS